MTFKWTYISAGVLAVAGVALSFTVEGGQWGAASQMIGIACIAAGGALVLLTRMSKPRLRYDDGPLAPSDVPFISYPEHQVIAIFETRTAAAEAVRAMRSEHVTASVEVYYGGAGTAAIDSEGVVHGLTGVTERSVEHLMSDLDDMTSYDEAVRAGRVVVSFDGRHEDLRRRGAGVLKAHGGHTIQYFGPLHVEVLDVDRSRTRV